MSALPGFAPSLHSSLGTSRGASLGSTKLLFNVYLEIGPGDIVERELNDSACYVFEDDLLAFEIRYPTPEIALAVDRLTRLDAGSFAREPRVILQLV